MKSLLKKTHLYRRYRNWQQGCHERKAVAEWAASGRSVPAPHLVKQSIVRHYARRFGLRTLVETGTYLGDMVEAMQHTFTRIYSVELDRDLHERAQARFAGREHIHLLQGDSGAVLLTVLQKLREPTLFWLDGHWSGGITAKGEKETPIVAECEAVLSHPVRGHVILIDDARCFTGENDYPTVAEMRALCERHAAVTFEVDADVIRVHE
jgi:hypothetical protein